MSDQKTYESKDNSKRSHFFLIFVSTFLLVIFTVCFILNALGLASKFYSFPIDPFLILTYGMGIGFSVFSFMIWLAWKRAKRS